MLGIVQDASVIAVTNTKAFPTRFNWGTFNKQMHNASGSTKSRGNHQSRSRGEGLHTVYGGGGGFGWPVSVELQGLWESRGEGPPREPSVFLRF